MNACASVASASERAKENETAMAKAMMANLKVEYPQILDQARSLKVWWDGDPDQVRDPARQSRDVR